MHTVTLSGEELVNRLLAITGKRDKNVYVYDSSGKMRRVVGVTVQELDPQSIVIETEEL